MKKQFFSAIFIACILFVGSATVDARAPLSFSGQAGFAIPQGDAFGDIGFGFSVDIDALWHFNQLNYRLGVGLAYNTSFLLAASDIEDVSLSTLNLFGVRGYYRFLNTRISPYGALTVGLGQFTDAIREESAFGLGIRPEIGVEFRRFVISVGYTVPMSYSLNGNDPVTAGGLQFSLGTRINLFRR